MVGAEQSQNKVPATIPALQEPGNRCTDMRVCREVTETALASTLVGEHNTPTTELLASIF